MSVESGEGRMEEETPGGGNTRNGAAGCWGFDVIKDWPKQAVAARAGRKPPAPRRDPRRAHAGHQQGQGGILQHALPKGLRSGGGRDHNPQGGHPLSRTR